MVNFHKANQHEGINMVRKPVRNLRSAYGESVISKEGRGARRFQDQNPKCKLTLCNIDCYRKYYFR